ncbi:hypothetical protein CBER1_11701 [Cercospora berteroae]|uniref:3-isopropylmalate dehydrogenase n=1 Tax=Cercospora berteroae TaxID=357750 RepID=A0A2S6CIM5_9PEZI|nr:hypothetical protein CBER1_11701 [Cercospora berteroae]
MVSAKVLTPDLEEQKLPRDSPSAVPSFDGPEVTKCVDPDLLTGSRQPLVDSGSLESYRFFDVNPNIGREFPHAKLTEWLRAPNSDQLLRDLAITVSRRNVVFFRAQDDMTIELQKLLAQRLGELSGKPAQNRLHIYPFVAPGSTNDDKEVVLFTENDTPRLPVHKLWHSDISYENAPSDYAVLRMLELPETGGDTIWASGYCAYDKLSRPMQSFLETLTLTSESNYHKFPVMPGTAGPDFSVPRGAPENVGSHIKAKHPVIRTNPVTGWNSLFMLGHHVTRINGVSPSEGQKLMDWMNELMVSSHDIQVRHRWLNKNDMAIWDNRCSAHTATPDHIGRGLGSRVGVRATSIGERPYFDPSAIDVVCYVGILAGVRRRKATSYPGLFRKHLLACTVPGHGSHTEDTPNLVINGTNLGALVLRNIPLRVNDTLAIELGGCNIGSEHGSTQLSMMRNHTIVVCAGDYCGPEVTAEALKVLREIERNTPDVTFNIVEHLIGGAAWDAFGVNITQAAIDDCIAASAVLVGAVGGPKWHDVEPGVEWGLGRLRKALHAFGNLRPIKLYSPCLSERSALKAEVCADTDILIVRELTGGIYFGPRQEPNGHFDEASDCDQYTRSEIERVTRLAGSLASQNQPPLQVTSVDKANVLAASGRLWRGVVTEVMQSEFPRVLLSHCLVDSAAMHLVRAPRSLNGILLTSNMFGDILSDEASAIVGSIGLLPSASLTDVPSPARATVPGLYEPVHGSAPDLSGKGIANPMGAILSVAMMCRYSLNLQQAADAVERAVESVLENGICTPDLGGSSRTWNVGDAIVKRLREA